MKLSESIVSLYEEFVFVSDWHRHWRRAFIIGLPVTVPAYLAGLVVGFVLVAVFYVIARSVELMIELWD